MRFAVWGLVDSVLEQCHGSVVRTLTWVMIHPQGVEV